ncbi:cytochrome c oxidase subunit 7A, mitochondrial-like [Neocloeon triangulifer]|uniref:cytochrome c oxidase subunit 7A, mitochondrial-like n=1 Tax=Neocloeon triangulifer TaxID=2078957 RepID=UPI00286F3621|nr:cytochrome c oxidase subunit 7A, mitochondrial-like [Neocloeon triangulifer]
MHHQFDNYTGRLTGATSAMWPYYPLSPRSYSKADRSQVIFDQKSTRAAQVQGNCRVVPRKQIPGTSYFYAPLDERLRLKMEHYQKPNGIPIHLKGGPADKVLFGVTVALLAVGIVSAFNLVYRMAVPKKQ